MDGTYSRCSDDSSSERRSGRDRRLQKFPSLKELLIHRRRRALRRKEDHKRVVLFDLYSTSIGIMVIVVLLLSTLDAVLTLFLINHGAVELNPIMAYFLNIGSATFLLVKYALTAMSVMIILLLNYVFVRHLNLQARSLLNYFAGLFALVVVWELYLVARYVL